MNSSEPTEIKPPVDRRREALIKSLRLRFSQARSHRNAATKQALFKEAAYLGIQPNLFSQPLTSFDCE
jgi:hypothetical protein